MAMPDMATNNRIRSNMFYCLIYLLITISITFGQDADLTETYRKFVFQKDMSENCRRRVMPSVFLGRHIVGANSQMMHFSRLEVPYSCFINIRTDMGSNIIVVIQVFTDVDLKTMCSQGDDQLLIYELGETFGGYWGQVPDSVMKHGAHRTERHYTLTPSQTTTTTKSSTRSTTTTPTTTEQTDAQRGKDKSEKDRGEYLTVELPIVNVSVELIPGQVPRNSGYTTEDNFELIYDVTPRPDEKYETRILPLIEVAVEKTKSHMRDDGKSDGDLSPEFEVQFDDLFTPDPRLTIPPIYPRGYKKKLKFPPSVNRRLNFKKNKQLFAAKEALFNKKRLYSFHRPQTNKLYNYLQSSTPLHDDKIDYKNNTWDVIRDILKNLTNAKEISTEPPHKELANILRGIAFKGLNKSVYLVPDLLEMDSLTPEFIATQHPHNFYTSIEQPNATALKLNDTSEYSTVSQDSNKSSNKWNVLDNNDSAINNDGASVALLPIALDVDNIILNGTKQNNYSDLFITPEAALDVIITTTVENKPDPLTVSLTNHESWENVVKAAPVMAVKLNQTSTTSTQRTKQATNVTKSRLRARRRRYIHAIDIEVAHPHHVQVMKHLTTTVPPEKFEMRDFQRLIELHDDEIHGRMAMRNVKRYVGLSLLKLCDFNETASRHVYLFNSSRLVLALSNFTLNRMMVVVTPARTLLTTESRCAPAHLECQVSGARVCIDAHSACDGVPNCGSYDIYDEDRLSCGAAAGLRHNVCLAAITFLAVLLTILYTIHYWLKRCIPKVSDAFFIYTDAAENELYLEPLMRSPHDTAVGKVYYHGGMQQYNIEYEDIVPKKNVFKIFFKRCLVFLRCRRKRHSNEILETELDNLYPQRISNLAELELNRMTGTTFGHTTDVAVQTSSSLEIGVLNLTSRYSKGEDLDQIKDSGSIDHLALMEADLGSNQPSDELNILQFFRRERSKSTSSHINRLEDAFVDISDISITDLHQEEKVIQSHEYIPEHYNIDEDIRPEQAHTATVDNSQFKGLVTARKHLRFREEAVIIPLPDDEVDDENVDIPQGNTRRSVVLGTNKVFRLQDMNNEPNEAEEPVSGTGREFKSYFNWGKEKKKKKPKKK